MRLTTVIILVTVFQLSAASTFGQKFTYKKNTTINQLFKEIKAQTGYNVIWYEGKLNSYMPVTVNFHNTPIEKVMDKVLAGRAVTYEIIGKAIVIKAPEPSFRDKVISFFTAIDVRGRVLDENNEPLVGAVVKVKGTTTTVVTDKNGEFLLKGLDDKAVLVISFLGYEPVEIIASKDVGIIKMIISNDDLKEVEIVSTGYQDIPKERATGSFALIDNKLLNRAVSPDLLSRLKTITNGLLFDNSQSTGNSLGISIRGRSTIFANTKPLIIVDNFPFEGDINTLNPDMIENVSLLKDAAAASIWGVRAGNGVIVINTKKGKLNQKPFITLKTDLTIGYKPDLYYLPQLTSSEFIDVEQFLYYKGAYTSIINNGYATISPVISILEKIRLNPSYASQGIAEINSLRDIDVRDQQLKLLYRNSTQERYFADIKGGGENQSYYFSVGYDKTLPSFITQSRSRVSLKGNNNYSLFKDRVKINSDISFSKSKSEDLNNVNPGYYPYEQLVDKNGDPLNAIYGNSLRGKYTDTAGNGKLLNWTFSTLEEIRQKHSTSKTDLTDYRLNLGLSYKIINPLSLSVNYQYYNASTKSVDLYEKDSFYTRNLVNTYSQINATSGTVIRPIPIGAIYTPQFSTHRSNYARGQLDFNKVLATKHQISSILGFEVRNDTYNFNSFTLFGYNPETSTSIPIDPISQFRNYYTGNTSKIGQPPVERVTTDRYVSYYANASYTYDNRLIASGSYRKDESNLFGVKANQKGVPLWSVGLAWNLHNEDFFKINWLSSLQLKTTYGYNGNVNNSISAYLTATTSESLNPFTNSLQSEIINPPNENLRWERVKNFNTGIYFSTRKNRFAGSVEYYIKNGLDLIGTSPIAPQTGISQFTGNTANTHTKGIDIELSSINLNGEFGWNTDYILNYVSNKVTAYQQVVGSNSDILSQVNLTPIVGYPVNSVFAYQWAGLDAFGNPQGYLDGIISTDYTKIRNSNDINQLVFFGSASPTIFGSFRNTFFYKNFEFSVNISYKMNYYFKRSSLNYSSLLATGSIGKQADYAKRWQNPGDELFTSVPSVVYPNNAGRAAFYSDAAILVERGDQIRLQDIQMNYTISKSKFKKLPFSEINIYTYANNLGLIWKNVKHDLDPDFRTTYPSPMTLSFGVKTNF